MLDLGGAAFVGDLIRGGVVGGDAVTHYFQCAPEQAAADVAAAVDRSEARVWFVGHFGPLMREAVVDFVADAAGTPSDP